MYVCPCVCWPCNDRLKEERLPPPPCEAFLRLLIIIIMVCSLPVSMTGTAQSGTKPLTGRPPFGVCVCVLGAKIAPGTAAPPSPRSHSLLCNRSRFIVVCKCTLLIECVLPRLPRVWLLPFSSRGSSGSGLCDGLCCCQESSKTHQPVTVAKQRPS